MSTSPHLADNIADQTPNPGGGPRTEEGKAASSQNAITNGLFTARDFIRPGEHEIYAQLDESLRADLAPSGPLEHNLVNEIRRAMWRLRRCGEVESNLVIGLDDGTGYIFDPMETTNADAEKVQRSVDRARALSHRLLHKCTAELRKLQTERNLRKATSPSDSATESSFCKTPVSPDKAPPQTPRNAACPCKSGLKFKRCCGKDAPAVLHAA